MSAASSGTALVEQILSGKRDQLAALCKIYSVTQLDLFGSAVAGAFDPTASDLDFLVEFGPPGNMNRADQYFGFMEALETLFGRPIDLVQPSAIRNPYFAQEVQATRVPIYACGNQEIPL